MTNSPKKKKKMPPINRTLQILTNGLLMSIQWTHIFVFVGYREGDALYVAILRRLFFLI